MVDRYQDLLDEAIKEQQAHKKAIKDVEDTTAAKIKECLDLDQFLQTNNLDLDQVTSHLRRNGKACMPKNAHRHYLKVRRWHNENMRHVKDTRIKNFSWSLICSLNRWKEFVEENKFSSYASLRSKSEDCNLRGEYAVIVDDLKVECNGVSIPPWTHVIKPNAKTAALWGDQEEAALDELRSEIQSVFSCTPISSFPPRLREAVKLLPNFSWPNGQEVPSSWPVSYYYHPQFGNWVKIPDCWNVMKKSVDNINALILLAFTLIRDVFVNFKRSVDEEAEEPANKRTK